ncbi:phage portal protein [Salipiger sp. IMCC34102]|nr:phage portal protein [Salipiger sp. IMCC34102]
MSFMSSTPMSADAIVDRNQRVLVAQSREQSTVNDYMKSFLRIAERSIVGANGIILQAQTRKRDGTLDVEANNALEAWWAKWCRAEHCDVTGKRSFRRICKAIVGGAARDGEFMVREVRGRDAGPMRYALQVLDPQRCPVDYNVDRMPNGRFVRQGIEFNRAGRPLAYYFASDDPSVAGYSFGGRSLDRIPAEQIIHGFVEDVLGQRRGLPWAATALWRLGMLDGFEKAALKNARTAASLGGFIEWETGEGPDRDEELEDEELYFEPEEGLYQELPPGARVKNVPSQYPTGEFTPFHKAMLRGAGAGMGVSYVSFANDLEGVNFSSIRQGVVDERDHWMDLQEWLIEVLVDRVYRGALEPALLMGIVVGDGVRLGPENLERYQAVRWQPRRWPWVDPTKDIAAEISAKDNLLTSPSEIIQRRGGDPDTVWRQYAQDIAAMRAAGMPEEFIMAAVLGVAPASNPKAGMPKAPAGEGGETEEKETDDGEDE